MSEPPDSTRHPSLGTAARGSVPDRRAGLVIVCDDCAMQCTATCDDCVVSYVLQVDVEEPESLTLDVAEARAVRLLAQAGLIPALQYRLAV